MRRSHTAKERPASQNRLAEMAKADLDFASIPIPPRLTPSPQSQPIDDEYIDANRIPIPPLRKSIFQHPTDTTWLVNVVQYSPNWPSQFETIAKHLHTLFTTSQPPAIYLTIEHIGSTSVPGLAAKPNIDILATFPSLLELENAIEALNWEIPSSPPFAKYTQIPRGGGIPGRESFKLYLPEENPYYATTPERSLYLIVDVEENEAGQRQIRCYRTLRDVLKQPENRDLFDEYAEFKLNLSKQTFKDGLEYSALKDGIVRKILLRGGWTKEEVEAKERLSRREWVVDVEEPY